MVETSYRASNGLVELIALHGFTPRQDRLLTLEAAALGTLYQKAEMPLWTEDETSTCEYRPASERQPSIQYGFAVEVVDRLHDHLVGERVFPTLKITGKGEAVVTKALEAFGLRDAMQWPAFDLLLGSGVLAFHLPEETKQIEDAGLRSVWSEPVFVAQVDSERSQAFAEAIAEAAGDEAARLLERVSIDDEIRWILPAPKDADSQDLAFLRYEWRYEEEVRRDGGLASDTVVYWQRVDYLPDAIIHYRPRRATDSNHGFEIERIDYTGWGLVPAVWIRPRRTPHGEADGPSILTPPVRSLNEAGDYAASVGQDAYMYNAQPQLLELDVKRDGDDDALIDPAEVERVNVASSGRVLSYTSTAAGDRSGSVSLLEQTGDSVTTNQEKLQQLYTRVQQLTGIVSYDQAQASGTLSGEALKRMLQPLLSRVDTYRAPLETALVLFIAKVASVLKTSVNVEVEWPDVVEPTAADHQAFAQAIGSMVGAGVLSQETAVGMVAAYLGLDDAAQEIERVKAEAAEKLAEQQKMMAAKAALGGNDGRDGRNAGATETDSTG